MFFSSYVYADDYKLHTVNFNIEGGEYLTEDIELILYYDDDTCTSILLENKNNYSASTVLREGEVKVEILNLIENENLNIEYNKKININKDQEYKLTVTEANKEKESKDIEIEEPKENKNYFKSNLLSILDTIMVTAIVLAIVAAIFGIIAIRRIIK